LCQSHSTAISECIDQDRVELMRERKRKLVIVVDEREQKTFSSLKSISIQNHLTDFQLNFKYLEVKSKNALLSKEVIFQGYRLMMEQMLGVGNEQTLDRMDGVMDWKVLALLVKGKLEVE